MRKAITHCRACGAPLIKNPLLSMAGMPKGAQFLPSRAQLKLERGVNLYIRQCSGCGLVQLDSTPVPYWREVIRAAAFSPEMGEFRKKQFSAFVKKYKLRGKKVLEPGCGKGEYLRLMAAAGARAYGLEYCAASVQEARRAGLKVTRGFVTGGGITGGSFDAFFTMNFLEHLPEPNVFLSGIAANLSPGGVGLVEVPNFDMVIRKKLFSEFIPDHLFYFTSDTLRSLLERNGFQVLSMKSVWHDYILSVEIRKRTSLDLKAFKSSQSAIATALNKYVSKFKPGRVAVWGAGHQALAVLALAKLGNRVRYVVDSAPFKQGKYTPATHIPIVSPAALKHDPVDAVIVMAASYSDEVERIIHKDFGGKLGVAILRETEFAVKG